MANVLGEVTAEHGGRTYTLRLTAMGVARLQEEHGNTVCGLLDGTAGGFPPMLPVIGLVREALRSGERMERDEAEALADELVTADMTIVQRVMEAFPAARAGKPKGRQKG